MKKLIWRLGKLPTVEELQVLVKDKIITQEEARDILFKSEDETDRDKESLRAEIKFLKELVEKLSNNNITKLVETIRYVERPYYTLPWYQPYQVWCSSSTNTTNLMYTGSGSTTTAASTMLASTGSSGTSKFSAINTL